MTLRPLILIMPASALLVSCKIVRTVPQTAETPRVGFESALAAQTFYEAVMAEQFPDPEGRSLTLSLAPLEIEKDRIKDSGLILSEAVSRADSNGDGEITEAEAQRFAKTVRP